jgi:diguanylate cyclase (GGDEF)-like protein
MESEMQRAIRYTIPLSLILLDVDKFKAFNDSFGHPAGDEVLKTVAKVLQQEARVTDFVARYGGEEFAIILTNTDYNGALVVAERIRAAIESAQWQNHVITASFGITTLLPHQHTAADLITQADRSLYYSKDNGRNCATHIFHVLDEEIRQSDGPMTTSATQRRRIAA